MSETPRHAQSPPADVAAALAAAAPRLASFARQVQWFDDVGSTNDVAAAYAERGAAEGLLIAAERQTAGRGRQGRTWASPDGAGLYVSLVLRPPPEALPLLTIAAGVALADAVATVTGLRPALKWPNDVYVKGRKLAGILAEAGVAAGGRAHAILGFGLNLLDAPLPADVEGTATSIEREIGRPVARGTMLAECLAALAARYDDLRGGRQAAVLAAWRAYARPFLGRRVEHDAAGGRATGIAEDVDETGALLVRGESGVRRIRSGEVRWS